MVASGSATGGCDRDDVDGSLEGVEGWFGGFVADMGKIMKGCRTRDASVLWAPMDRSPPADQTWTKPYTFSTRRTCDEPTSPLRLEGPVEKFETFLDAAGYS